MIVILPKLIILLILVMLMALMVKIIKAIVFPKNYLSEAEEAVDELIECDIKENELAQKIKKHKSQKIDNSKNEKIIDEFISNERGN